MGVTGFYRLGALVLPAVTGCDGTRVANVTLELIGDKFADDMKGELATWRSFIGRERKKLMYS